MDNRLPAAAAISARPCRSLRQSGYIGPIGVISSSHHRPYFQTIDDYGVDFRIDKAETGPDRHRIYHRVEYSSSKDMREA